MADSKNSSSRLYFLLAKESYCLSGPASRWRLVDLLAGVFVMVGFGGFCPDQGENNANDQSQSQPTRYGMDSIIKNIFGQGSIQSQHGHNKNEEEEKFFQNGFPISGSPANGDCSWRLVWRMPFSVTIKLFAPKTTGLIINTLEV